MKKGVESRTVSLETFVRLKILRANIYVIIAKLRPSSSSAGMSEALISISADHPLPPRVSKSLKNLFEMARIFLDF